MTGRLRFLGLAWTAVAVFAVSAQAAGLTVPEKRGKQIYLRGVNSAGKEIAAFLGNPPMDVPGSLMACANCHGWDGTGNPEGGVVPSDITWQTLTKPYGVVHASGRRHPPYSPASLERAVLAGFDPAGNKLNPSMPLYKMPPEDLADLVAYLRRLGDDRDPGLTEDTLTLGTLVPVQGPLAAAGATLRSVLAGYFDELNAQGGIYSRKIELRIAECGQSAQETRDNVARFVEQDGVFALVGAFMAGADKEISALMEEKELPLIGPSTVYPQTGYPLNRQVFYLFPGVKEEGRALAIHASRTFGNGSTAAALYPDEKTSAETADAIEAQCRKSEWVKLSRLAYPPGRFDAKTLAKKMHEDGTTVVFFLGSGREELALAEEAARIDWKPVLLLPGSLAGREILSTSTAFQGRIYMSFPLRSSDQTPAAAAQYRDFAARHKIEAGNLAVALSAYSAARVLVEGLKKAGRDVSREKLIAALEGMYKFETGLTPPFTYGANRRIGAQGAYVAEVEFARKNLIPVGGWIEVQ